MVYAAYFAIFALAYVVMMWPYIVSHLRRQRQTYRHKRHHAN